MHLDRYQGLLRWLALLMVLLVLGGPLQRVYGQNSGSPSADALNKSFGVTAQGCTFGEFAADCDFGNVAQGSFSGQGIRWTADEGNLEPINVSLIDVVEGGADFRVDHPGGVILDPGEFFDFSVTFGPTMAGFQDGRVEIVTRDIDTDDVIQVYDVNLMGVGIGEQPVYDFGDVSVGGEASLEGVFIVPPGFPFGYGSITDISILGGGSVFTEDFIGPELLQPGIDVLYDVIFSPLTLGLAQAELLVELRRNDTNAIAFVQRIALVGNGIPPAPNIVVDPLSLDFDEQAVGELVTLPLTITNTGTLDLILTSFDVTGTYAGDYTAPTGLNGTVLLPGGSVVADIGFQPNGIGLRDAQLLISSNDPDTPALPVPLMGQGVQSMPLLEVSPSSINFGNVRIGNTLQQDIMVANEGNGILNVSSIQVQGSASTDFEVSSSMLALAPGENEIIQVTFDPQARGMREAQVAFTSNGGNATVDVTGQGVAPQLVAPTSVTLPSTPVGESSMASFDLSNTGNASLRVTSLTLGQPNGPFQITRGGTVPLLTVGSLHSIEITFSPTSSGQQNDILTILSDDPLQPEVMVALSGQSGNSFVVDPSTIDFQDVEVGSSLNDAIGFQNIGTSPITITQLQTSGATSFNTTATFPVLVDGGTTAVIPVTFAPTTRGAVAATWTLITDADGATAMVSLMGTGIAAVAQVDQQQLDFGLTTLGTSTERMLTISNQGDAQLLVSSTQINGAEAAAFTVQGGDSFTLDPSQSRILTLSFAPLQGDSYSATLVMETNDPAQPNVNVPLSGQGAPIINTTAQLGTLGQVASVGFTVPNNLVGAAGTLFYRLSGQAAFQSMGLSANGSVYTGTIPGNMVQTRGVQYYAQFQTDDLLVTYPAADAATMPAEIRVQIPQADSPLSLSPTQYEMVSVPFGILAESVETVLGDDFGPYDPNVWRLLRWDPIDGAYTEFPMIREGSELVDFLPGRGAWLITAEGLPYDIENGISTSASEPYEMVLQPGFNQIGTPFAFPVAWSDVIFTGDVSPPVAYDGAQYIPGQTILQPWQGYFVENEETIPVTIAFQPIETVTNTSLSLAQRYVDTGAFVIQAQAITGRGRDTENFLVLEHEASKYAIPQMWHALREPPAIDETVRLHIVEDNEEFAALVKRSENEGQTWDLEITGAFDLTQRFQKRDVAVLLQEFGARPEGYDLWVVDLDEGRMLESTGGRFTVTLEERRPTRRLRVVLGTESFAGSATDGIPIGPTELLANYPNPFEEQTEIAFRLGVANTVRVEVFDVLGRRVRTLLEADRGIGRHTVVWDGKDDAGRTMASGLYVCRLQAGTFTSTRQLVLLR